MCFAVGGIAQRLSHKPGYNFFLVGLSIYIKQSIIEYKADRKSTQVTTAQLCNRVMNPVTVLRF